MLQVEFCDAAAEAAGTTCRHLYECLESFGYRMFRYDFSTRALIAEPAERRVSICEFDGSEKS